METALQLFWVITTGAVMKCLVFKRLNNWTATTNSVTTARFMAENVSKAHSPDLSLTYFYGEKIQDLVEKN